MWKIMVGFGVIAAVTVWLLSKGGDIDLSGEKHGIDAHGPAAASAPASAPSMAASQ